MSWAGIEKDGRSRVRGAALRSTAGALGLCAAILVTSGPANAQFVCDSSGGGASATGAGSFACGTAATANGDNATATGVGAFASGDNAAATGAGAVANGDNTTATGVGAAATAVGGTATGYSAQASGTNSTATGTLSTASGVNSTANGNEAHATAAGATAVGYSSEATASSATAFGENTKAYGADSVAVGANAAALGQGAIAIGNNSAATFDNSTAIGNGASTNSANQVAIGTATNTYRLAGITSAASTAAQSGPLSVVTTDVNGNLAAVDLASLGLSGGSSVDLSEINSRLDQHDKKISKNTEGVAIALAMAGVPTLTSSEKFAMSANWGTFEGENGFAGGAAIRLDSNIQLNGGIGFGGETVGGRAGVRIGW